MVVRAFDAQAPARLRVFRKVFLRRSAICRASVRKESRICSEVTTASLDAETSSAWGSTRFGPLRLSPTGAKRREDDRRQGGTWWSVKGLRARSPGITRLAHVLPRE
jgi:hypothetical protein